jgi:hypothetical protein
MIAQGGLGPGPRPLVPELPQVPYRGIESFRYIDQPIFCARESETRKLVRSMTIYRGVLLYGASGSGKSSLINAGLIPELVNDGFYCERIRVQPRLGEEMIVERIPLTQDGRPPYLPSFFEDEEDGQGGMGDLLAKFVHSVLGEKETEARIVFPVADFLARLDAGARDRSVLLIFDQFEEFVTLFEEAPQVQSLQEAKKIQTAILSALVNLLRNSSLRVKLLFAFREDYLARLAALFRQCPDLTDQYLRLTPPDKGALLGIVRGPFKSDRAREHFGREMSEEIVNGLAAEIEKRDDGDLLNLSEIEIVCDRLWHSDNPTQLLKKRGVQGLLEDYLSDELVRLKDLRSPAVALLSRMVTSGGTRNVISEANLLDQVRQEEKLPEDTLKTALIALEKDTRLVQRERRNRVYFYEIVSEFLVPWISRQKDLRAAARERRDLRRKALAVLVLIGLMSAALAGWQIKQNSVVILRNRLKAAESRRDDYYAKWLGTEEALEKRGNELKDRNTLLKTLQGERSSLQSRFDGLQDKHRDLLGQLDATAKDLDRSKQAIQDQQTEIDRQAGLLQEERNGRRADIAGLRDQMAEQQRSAQNVIDDLQERQAQAELHWQSEQRKALEDLATKTSEAESLKNALDAERRESQDRVAKLNRELTTANATASACRNEKASLVREKEKAEADANQARVELTACKGGSEGPAGPPR